jgi:uncharacterized protein YoaH (UPF0181 family)
MSILFRPNAITPVAEQVRRHHRQEERRARQDDEPHTECVK